MSTYYKLSKKLIISFVFIPHYANNKNGNQNSFFLNYHYFEDKKINSFQPTAIILLSDNVKKKYIYIHKTITIIYYFLKYILKIY